MTLGHDIKGTSYCEFYNGTACPESQPGCIEREECSPSEPDKRNHCYVVWKYDKETKKSTAVLKVCSLFTFYRKLYILHIYDSNYQLIIDMRF